LSARERRVHLHTPKAAKQRFKALVDENKFVATQKGLGVLVPSDAT
jgi:hypothetical protein